MPNLFKLLKKPNTEPLPEFPRITMQEIPKASGLAWYGVNRVTELFGSRVYGHPWEPPASHISTFLGEHPVTKKYVHLNVGAFRQIEEVEKDFTPRRRVDVIVYNLSQKERKAIAETCWADQSRLDGPVEMSDYAWSDFLRFGVKWFKPSKKDFCSENHVENFLKHNIRTSHEEPYNSGPWDLVEFAHETGLAMYTLHIGEDFK